MESAVFKIIFQPLGRFFKSAPSSTPGNPSPRRFLFFLLLPFFLLLAACDGNGFAPVAYTQVSTGLLHSCAIYGGSVVCWGDDYYGQSTPPALSNPTQVSAGGYHSCALNNRGVVCWGADGAGQSTPPSLSNPTQVSAGGYHTCALDDTGVVCWGTDGEGQSSPPTLSNPQHLCILLGTGIVEPDHTAVPHQSHPGIGRGVPLLCH